MIIPGVWGLSLIIFSILLALSIVKRVDRENGNEKSGCGFIGYISVVVFCISIFTLMISYALISTTYVKIDAFINGDSYVAKVVDYKVNEGDEGDVYTSIFEFTTIDGATKRVSANESYTPDKMGKTFKIIWNEKTDNVLIFSTYVVGEVVVLLFMLIVFGVLFLGLLLYALGVDMAKYFNFLAIFSLPFLLIASDILFIGGFFSTLNLGMLIFIVPITFVIYWYIKMLIKKGRPRWTRTSASSWSMDWDSVHDRKRAEAQQRQNIRIRNREESE